MKNTLKSFFLRDIAKISVGKDLIEASFSPDLTDTHIFPVYSNTVSHKGLYGYYDFEEYAANCLTVVGRGAGLGTAFPRPEGFGAIGRLLVLRPLSNGFDVRYLAEYINNKLIIFNESGGIPQLPGESLAKYKVELPPLPEQKAIADLLSTWDSAIEKTERLIAAKESFYNAELSARLSQGIVDRVKLKKFLKEVSTRNRNLAITQVLSVTNSRGFVRPEDQFDRQVASDNLSNYKVVLKGEYAYNPSRVNVGSIARLDGWDEGVLSPMYTVFSIKKNSGLNSELFLHWLNSHEAKQRIRLSAQGSVRETVSFDDFCAIGFPVITNDEQIKLADYFNLLSEEISSLKSLAEKYKEQKRGLMQKLLTGEWRVKEA